MADEGIKTKITIRGGNWEPGREVTDYRPVKYLLRETVSKVP